MKFANPYFLFALTALAVPIIIHLFNFRRFKRVYFTNVRFLREVKQETQSRNRLKHLLVLLCRCLALSFLVLAFAQPFLPVSERNVTTGVKAVSIYVDNSFSMDAVNKSNTTLLKEARDNAAEIAAAFAPSDRFQLLTNDFEGRHQRFVNREEFLELLDEVQPSPTVRTLAEVAARQQDLLANADEVQSQEKNAFLISDFQRTTADFSKIKTDTSIRFQLVPVLAQNRNNIFIDTCWFESPVRRLNQQEALHVRLRSRSDQEMENVPMRLFINGQAKTPASFNIAPNSTTDTVIYFTIREPGLQQGRIEINDYPVTFDDKFYFSFDVLQYIPVLAINPAAPSGLALNGQSDTESPYLNTLFGNDSTFRYTKTDENKIDYASLSGFRFIVLNQLRSVSTGLGQELKKFVQNGGSIFVFPAAQLEPNSYRDFLSSLSCNVYETFDTTRMPVDRINYEHPLYQGVFERRSGNIDLPVTKGHYRMSRAVRTTQDDLLRLRNGDVFLAATPFGKGKVYTCTSPLDPAYSNFAQHAVFVPSMYQAALFSQPQSKLFRTIGQDETVNLPASFSGTENVFHLTAPERKFDIIPSVLVNETGIVIDAQQQVREPGNYFVDASGQHVTAVAFNYDRKESDLGVLTPEEIKKQYADAGLSNFFLLEAGDKGLTAALTEINEGIKLWKWCIWLALLFLLAEVLLLRFWKTDIKPKTSNATAV